MEEGAPNDLGLHRLWLSPFTPEVRGGLRHTMNQYTDGAKTILSPKRRPESQRIKSQVIPVDADPTPPAVCIPVDVSVVDVSPVKDPYDVGDEITCTAFGLSGTEPYNYQWFLNGIPVSNNPTFVHTLVEGDVQNKDGSGLGVAFIYVLVTNSCGADFTDPSSTINVQGTP